MAALLLLFSASLCLSYAAPTPATNNIMPKFVFSKGEDGKLLPVDARLVTIFNRIYSNGTMVEEKKVTELGVNQVGTEGGNSENGQAGLSLVTVQNEFYGDAGLDELKDMVQGLQTAVEDLTFLLTEKMEQTDEMGLEDTQHERLNNSTAHCPPGFVEGPEACYWFSRDKQPYLLAEHVCTTKGGRLAMAKTKQVHVFLGRYIHRTTKASHWIGLTDLLKERHFHWSDGTPLQPGDYMPWWRRQPDNSRRREHCVELKKVARYKWNDMPCTGLLHYVCERDI
ncbi:PREDICTED: CD209 antigen-like protein C [Branchiostoma belcheri]|uniref:CD209 antigen-like protein C n=1 Tax=Branchiostoma belcheri TaxID=7741 RepID=A0A6P4ZP36_BRABE|nr:PREDICTED: CD209 antigen-like protein C [Branchiostoma belcheri]